MPSRRRTAEAGGLPFAALLLAGVVVAGWGAPTVRQVAWTAVQFFPPDLARQVHRHDDRFDAGIARGLAARSARWQATRGDLVLGAELETRRAMTALRTPVPLGDLVEDLGVLAVCVADANDPLAVSDADPREPTYGDAYRRYVDSILGRVRLVYYGRDAGLLGGRLGATLTAAVQRSRNLYPYVGQEFYRTGQLRDWRSFDDRSVAFGVAGVALSRAMTDVANVAAYVWKGGGGLVPAPRPTPAGHVGPTVTVALEGGLPERDRPKRGKPAMPQGRIALPPP